MENTQQKTGESIRAEKGAPLTADELFVGQLVEWQSYSPAGWSPDGEERSHPYGPTRVMLIRGIHRESENYVKVCLADPDRPNSESRMSWPTLHSSDLWQSHEDGALF